MQETIARIRKFRDDRDWKQFHDPKSLAASICIEAAELLEIFQWMTGEQASRYAAENKERVSDEMADVAIYLVELGGGNLLRARIEQARLADGVDGEAAQIRAQVAPGVEVPVVAVVHEPLG